MGVGGTGQQNRAFSSLPSPMYVYSRLLGLLPDRKMKLRKTLRGGNLKTKSYSESLQPFSQTSLPPCILTILYTHTHTHTCIQRKQAEGNHLHPLFIQPRSVPDLPCFCCCCLFLFIFIYLFIHLFILLFPFLNRSKYLLKFFFHQLSVFFSSRKGQGC